MAREAILSDSDGVKVAKTVTYTIWRIWGDGSFSGGIRVTLPEYLESHRLASPPLERGVRGDFRGSAITSRSVTLIVNHDDLVMSYSIFHRRFFR